MKINLQKSMFSPVEFELVSHGELCAKTFTFSTGVEAVRIENKKGYFTVLPFQGQVIWNAHFLGRDLGMITLVKEPMAGVSYLRTYGGFLYHCGVTSMGAKEGDLPQHGEIPNHPYDNAYLLCGEDEKGKFMEIGGHLEYHVAYVRSYRFSPSVRLYENGTVLFVTSEIKNLKKSPMEYMYLCHINHRPVNGAKIIDTGIYEKGSFRVHKAIPASFPEEAQKKLSDYMDLVEEKPETHLEVGNPYECYNPEICFTVKYQTDENGKAYVMQYEKGNGGVFVSHPAKLLPYGIRWISRTEDEDSMGMVLPATDEHLGYAAAKKAGTVKSLGAEESIVFQMQTGLLTEQEAQALIQKIDQIKSK